MRSSRVVTLAASALCLVVLAVACKEAQNSIRPDAQRIPAPTPNASPHDVPPAAERAALGSSGQGGGQQPRRATEADLHGTEDQKLAVNTSLDNAKKDAQERAEGRPLSNPAPSGTLGANPKAPANATANANPNSNPNAIPSGSANPADVLPLPGQAVERAMLVFSASTAGQLVPCGCSPDMRGGLPRAAGRLAEWRTEDPALVYVDLGDLLFASEKPGKGNLAAQAELKARTLAQGMAAMGAAARVVGARDLAKGPAFVAQTAGKVPLLQAGVAVPGALPSIIVKAGKTAIPIGIFAAGAGPQAQDDKTKASLRASAEALRAQGARLVILVLHHEQKAAQALLAEAREAGVDLVLLGHRADPALDPDLADAGEPPFLRVEGHGQSLLRVDLALPVAPSPSPAAIAGVAASKPPARQPLVLLKGSAGKLDEANSLGLRIGMMKERLATTPDALKPQVVEKISELEARQKQVLTAPEQPPPGAPVATARFVRLGQDTPTDPQVAALVAAYDNKVAEQNLALAKKEPAACPKPAKGEEFFVGVSAPSLPAGKPGKPGAACASCHTTEAQFWTRTPHAHAFQTLVAVNKQFSLECIRCHVTGWQQPGGVCRIDKTEVGGPGLDDQGAPAPSAKGTDAAQRFGVGRRDVQCEMCHEVSSNHATKLGPKSEDVPVTTCQRCHEAENSPHFDYDKYLPWVIGPGHGRKLKKGDEPRSLGELATGDRGGPNSVLREALKAKPATPAAHP